jgi:hypothetical protein
MLYRPLRNGLSDASLTRERIAATGGVAHHAVVIRAQVKPTDVIHPVSATERSPSIEHSAYPRGPLRQIRRRHRCMCRQIPC